jgi:hypothetical protein
MAIIFKVNKVNLFVSSLLFVFWFHSPNFLDTPRMPRPQDLLLTSQQPHQHQHQAASLHSVSLLITDAQPIMAFLLTLYDFFFFFFFYWAPEPGARGLYRSHVGLLY